MIQLRKPGSKHQWIALLLGVAFAAGSAIPLAQGVISLGWSKVHGEITHSAEKPGYRTIGVDVRYRYAAGGRTYTGDRYRFQFVLLRDQMESRDVESIVGRYRVGEGVEVAVNPRDPGDSVLVAGPDLEGLLPLGAGLLLMLAGVGEPAKTERAPKRRWTAKVLAVTGGALMLFGARDVYQGLSSLRWPQAEGRILYSSARMDETLLWYEYHVANTRYLAGKYRTGGNSTPFRDVAEAAAKRYPAGRAVKVHYNPWNPGEALLEPGVWYGNFVLPGIGALVLAAAWVAKKYAEAMAGRERR